MSHECEQKDRMKSLETDVIIIKEKLSNLNERLGYELNTVKSSFQQEIKYLIEKMNGITVFQSKLIWWMIGTFTTSIFTAIGVIFTLLTR